MAEAGRDISDADDLQASCDTAVTRRQDPLIGKELAGRYRVLELIGSGGWGNVYRAEHSTLGSDLAVKVIHRHLAQDEPSRKRMEQEAKLLSSLQSPYIVRILDYALIPAPFIVTEYFDGTPLNKWLHSEGPLSYQNALELFSQICQGLEQAEAVGLVHRDLKPANVLVKFENECLKSKLLDFGIAKIINDAAGEEKIISTDEVLGSPPYMSPEQWSGRADHRSDIYSLGCVMYEAVSGKQAFTAGCGMDYLHQHLSATPPRIKQVPGREFPPDFERVIFKCMQKSPASRYQKSGDILSDLNSIRAGQKVQISLASQKLFSNAKMRIGLITALVVLSILGSLNYTTFIRVACENLNTQADREKRSGKLAEASLKFRLSLYLSRGLPRQDRCKLHSLRSLIDILKEQSSWKESKGLEEELNKLLGSEPSAQLLPVLERLKMAKEQQQSPLEAESISQKALSEAEKMGKHTLTYSRVLEDVAVISLLRGKYETAIDYEQQSLKIVQDLCEPDDPQISDRYRNLGRLFDASGKLEDAAAAYRQSLEQNKKANRRHEASADLNALGALLLKSGKYQEALSAFEEGYQTKIQTGEKVSSAIIKNIASTYLKLGNKQKSIEYMKKTLEQRTLEGSDQLPMNEILWSTLGGLYADTNDLGNADACFEKGLALRLCSGVLHPRVPAILSRLIQIKTQLGKTEAVASLKQVFAYVNKSKTQGPTSAKQRQADVPDILLGQWWSTEGPVVLKQSGNVITGFIIEYGKTQLRNEIYEGNYDPASRTLDIKYYQPWDQADGASRLILSSDNLKLGGPWKDSAGRSGNWTLWRKPGS